MQMTSSQGGTLVTFGQRVRAVRQARRIKLIVCAKQIGISRTGLQAWESDGVANPDTGKLLAFTKLTDCSLDWLIDGRGPAPDLAVNLKPPRRITAVAETAAAKETRSIGVEIPEITATMSQHATQLDLTPRAMWRIPLEVVEIGFNSVAGHLAIKRVITREGSDFGVGRGDYVLIDTSRTRIDEVGVYLLADPEGKSARRARVDWCNVALRITILADDIDREDSEIASDAPMTVLGRIMGVFKPV